MTVYAKRSIDERRARLWGEGGGPGGGWRCWGAVRASDLSKKSHIKTPEVFFHAAFDFDAPGLQNTDKK